MNEIITANLLATKRKKRNTEIEYWQISIENCGLKICTILISDSRIYFSRPVSLSISMMNELTKICEICQLQIWEDAKHFEYC